jgi:saccharopine dehydrogenase-like NADP-dependent oxidoreductase
MTRIAIVGLGHMGLSALKILCTRVPDAEFVAIDRSAEAVARATRIGGNVWGREADVMAEDLDLQGVDLVVNLAGPFFSGSDRVARAALRAGTTYVDIGDDVEATDAVIALDEQARSVGVCLITGAGLSPGVSNWMASRLLEEQPQADGIQVAWVVHESDPGGLAPLRHMLHMAVNPCPVWRDGEWQQSPGFVPSTAASFDFPQPLGRVEAYDTAHPEPRTLARHFPQLRYASCKGALQPEWANSAFSTLGRIGFGYADLEVDINGVRVEPAEFLWKLLWARHGRKRAREATATTSVLVQALEGERVLDALAIVDDEVMARGTGLGAATAALVALEQCPPAGAWGPEVLAWRPALDLFEQLARAEDGYREGVLRMPPLVPSTR